MSSNPIWPVSLLKERLGHRHAQLEDHVKTGGESLGMKSTFLASWTWTSGFQNCEEINLFCLSGQSWYTLAVLAHHHWSSGGSCRPGITERLNLWSYQLVMRSWASCFCPSLQSPHTSKEEIHLSFPHAQKGAFYMYVKEDRKGQHCWVISYSSPMSFYFLNSWIHF